jgi:hypothetical protein
VSRRVRVYLDDEPYELVPGSRVVDLVACLPAARRAAYEAGELRLVDPHGHEVGSHGDLVPEQRLRLIPNAGA